MDEFEIIRRFFTRRPEAPDVIEGIGDDGAVLRPRDGYDQVAVVDTIIAGVHYPLATDPRDVGYRAVAVNLSDIAAMGARPRWMTLALTLADADEHWLGEFAQGLFGIAGEYGVDLIGGDTTSGDQVVVSVQIAGEVARGRAVLRRGARPGDTVFVTGTIGDAAAGLDCLRRDVADEYLAGRFLRPTPRIDIGNRLAEFATAAIDISDGLAADLCRLLDASKTGAEIDAGRIPVSAALARRYSRDEYLSFVLGGGDDYELCFTAPAEAVPASVQGAVTAIGRITDGAGLVVRDDGAVVEIGDSGYRHFR